MPRRPAAHSRRCDALTLPSNPGSDLKPENILLKQPNRSGIKVIDFGSSCFEEERVYTYIQSRFYRAPEIILGMPYGLPIDMWSFGCILAELYTGYPLFPGEDEAEQLACIMELFNAPSKRLLAKASRRKHFFDSTGRPRIAPNSRGRKRRPGAKDLATTLRCNGAVSGLLRRLQGSSVLTILPPPTARADSLFVHFLSCCLRWDPEERMTPAEALQHQWILEGTVASASRLRGESGASSVRRHRRRSHRRGAGVSEARAARQAAPNLPPIGGAGR